MRGDLACRVVATIFALQGDAGDTKTHDLLRLLGRQLTLEIDELFGGVEQALFEIALGHADDARQLLHLFGCSFHIGRARPHGLGGCADGQWLTVAVGDHAAMGGHFDDTSVTGITLLLQEVVVDTLQIDGTHQQTRHACKQEQEQQARTPCRECLLRRGLR